MSIKIAIADDHLMVIEGIANLLKPYEHLEVIARYSTGAALLEGLIEQQPDVLLLDLQFPDTTGNDLMRVIAKKYPKVRVLAISSVENPFHVKDMLQHGCKGYVLKSVGQAVLLEAIESVNRGEEYLEPAMKEQLLQAFMNPTSKHLKTIRLTKREQEILEMICAGNTNYEIGDKLFLSHRTVENHRLSLYQKFDVKNTAMLVKVALQHGLIS